MEIVVTLLILAVVGMIAVSWYLGRDSKPAAAKDQAEAIRSRVEQKAKKRSDKEAWDDFNSKFGS